MLGLALRFSAELLSCICHICHTYEDWCEALFVLRLAIFVRRSRRLAEVSIVLANGILAGSSQRLASEWYVDWLQPGSCYRIARWLAPVNIWPTNGMLTSSSQRLATELHVGWLQSAFGLQMVC